MGIFEALTAPIVVRPGAPLGSSIQSPRRDIAQALVAVTPVQQLPQVLAMAFNLCGHAHELAATMALRAAGVVLQEPMSDGDGLRRQTFLEHLRRMHLDWPRQLSADSASSSAEAVAALRESPLGFAHESEDVFWPQAQQWLADTWFAQPIDHWLEHWGADPNDCVVTWARQRDHWIAGCLRHAAHFDVELAAPEPGLDTELSLDRLAEFGLAVLGDASQAIQPRWQGVCRHTGTWTRDPSQGYAPVRWSALRLLGARLAETARLALGVTEMKLLSLNIGPGQGVAAVQMARGLLIHAASCETSAAPGTAIAHTYRVIAPTEWNFHPRGSLAQTLSGLQGRDERTIRRTQVLMAAFDPCVAYETQPMPLPEDASCMN